MKFKAVDPDGIYPHEPIYEPRNRKHGEQLMKLHTDMGDEILILEDWDDEAE